MFFFYKIIFLILINLYKINSDIILEKLSGLEPVYDYDFNSFILSDKMVGILNYMSYALHLGENENIPKTASEATYYNYSFENPWNNDVRETGFGALRYNIAFASYAIASTGARFFPSYPEYVANDLRAAVGRIVNPVVWSYWSQKGICGAPWNLFCKIYNYSMCEISNFFGNTACPDPVFNQNVMYSGHLAQIMTLYETFSSEFSLSKNGWIFYNQDYKNKKKKPSKYNLKKLIEVITNQKKKSPIGAFSCEPSIIYTACNQHSIISSILYDSIHNTSYTKIGNQAKFLDWIKTNGIHLEKYNKTDNTSFSLKESYYVGATQIDLERIMYFFPEIRNYFRSIIKNRDGLVGLDGWVNQWLEIWRPNTKEGFEMIKNGISNLSSNNAWEKYRYIKNKELWYLKNDLISELGMFNFTVSTATSFSIAGLGGFSKLTKNKTLVRGSLNFLDWCSGKKYITKKYNIPMWFLDTQGGDILSQCQMKNNIIKKKPLDNILNTANLLQGLVYNSDILRSLYNGTLMKKSFSSPHILNIYGKKKIALKLAKYQQINDNYGELYLVLSSLDKFNKFIKIYVNITKQYNLIRCNKSNFYEIKKCNLISKKIVECKLKINGSSLTKYRLCFEK